MGHPFTPEGIIFIQAISAKSLPFSRSFCSVGKGSLVISALKKCDLGSDILLCACETEDSEASARVEFLGRTSICSEVNLLEEEMGQMSREIVTVRTDEIKFEDHASQAD